jgi:hypothetical protein
MGSQRGTRQQVRQLGITAATVAGLGLAAGTGTLVTGTVGIGTLSAAVASTATGSHWSIVARANSALDTIVAPAAASAWALGTRAGPSSTTLPAGVHWNGHRWSQVTFPATVKSGIGCSAASSPGNAWAIAGSSLYGGSATYAGALRLSGGKWVVKKSFAPAGLVSGCTVLSPANGWVYGLTHVAPGVGTWRLKGATWSPVTTGSFDLISASQVSAGNIWAMAADMVGNDDVVAHWNGTAWRSDASFAAALPAQSSTLTWDVSAINAVAAGNVWVAGTIMRENSHGNWIASKYVLHLSGGTWWYVAPSNPGYYLPGAVSDGHGGWWSQGNGLEFGLGTASAKPYLLHRTGTHWSRLTIAAPKGYTMQIMDVVHVPNSSAMLAVAALYNGKAALHSVVLADGQLPK